MQDTPHMVPRTGDAARRIARILIALVATQPWSACRERHVDSSSTPSATTSAVVTSPAIVISDISFAGPAGHRPDANFYPGETVLCLLTASNFTYQKHRAHLVADLLVKGPAGIVVLEEKQKELLKGQAPTLRPGMIRTAASLPISASAPAGRYSVMIKVRDLLGKREGAGQGSFTLLGTPPAKPAAHLSLTQLRFPAGPKMPVPSVQPVAFVLSGFGAHQGKQGYYTGKVKLSARVQQQDQELTRHGQLMLKKPLPFLPAASPLEYQLNLPASLAPGSYQLVLTAQDLIKGEQSSGHLDFQVVPSRFGIYTLHIHDAAGLPRSSFLFGEQVFVRFAVHGLEQRTHEIKAEVDLAIAGPDGGVYLAQKKAATTAGPVAKAMAQAGRWPVQVPLVLPALAPAGPYRLVIRARDLWAKRETVSELTLNLEGWSPPRFTELKIDELQVRDRPDLLPQKGDTFGAGRRYYLTLSLGGLNPKEKKRLLYEIQLEGNLRLKNRIGQVVHQQRGLFNLHKTVTYKPLRLLIPVWWTVPAELGGGLYDLEVNVLNVADDRVSHFQRRVEIVPRRPVSTELNR